MDATIDEQGRPEPPPAADEVTSVLGFLDFQRATLEWKTRGLDAPGLAATTAASQMTLGGLLKHLAFVESYWFRYRLLGNSPGAPWEAVDWDAEPDWDWDSAGSDSPAELRSLWESSVERSRRAVTEVLADGHADLIREAVDGETGE